MWEGQRVERTNARGRHTYVPAFKRWIVEQAQRPGVSVAGPALSDQVNANQLRHWVQLQGNVGPGSSPAATLLPVTVVAPAVPAVPSCNTRASIEIELADAMVRVQDGVAAATLRMALACLRGTAP